MDHLTELQGATQSVAHIKITERLHLLALMQWDNETAGISWSSLGILDDEDENDAVGSWRTVPNLQAG